MKNSSRRDFLRTIGIAAAIGLTGCSTRPKKKPNVLFIFADDQAFDTINALGYRDVQTPNLDRLVKSGVTFTHAYNMGAWHGAVCVASRTMLNTGRFLWKAKDHEPKLREEQNAAVREISAMWQYYTWSRMILKKEK